MALDLEALVQPISDETPCGTDLSDDAAFFELDQLFKGPQAQEIVGEAEREEPNWKEVRSAAMELLTKTKDLRILVQLLVAEMLLDGTRGLRDGLRVLDSSVARYWDSIHPMLDPDDDNDPTERVNILAALAMAPGSMGDPVRFRERLNQMTLLDADRLGKITLRDVRCDQDPSLVSGEETTDQIRARIMGIVTESDAEAVSNAFDWISQAVEAMDAVDESLTMHVGAGAAANFEEPKKDLRDAKAAVQGWMDLRGMGSGAEEGEGEMGAEEGAMGGGGGGGAPGEIRSRKDVELALQRIRQYYEKMEPSSPVPLFLGAAEAMIAKSFIEITEAMPPDATGTVVRIRDAAHGGGGME